ncbi:MAG: class I SAM-dependent methyltransferase [Holosporaceae bacterium]|jgi:SAM-dependent methyltransferase|nr:class I SAM-dependent methyltransferase [Holosporaceae bacterium]
MEDYITEIPYISNYYCDLNPAHLSFIAALNGFRPPDVLKNFSYCELGCGCGKTTNIVAAAYPYSDCTGIDINKEHIRIARSESVGLKNIKFLDVSFREALPQNLPRFDFITAHGIWSWVGDSARTDILKFVRKFLKPNGILYLSYDAMPGWSQLAPFHKIIFAYANDKKGSITEKASAALTYLQFLNGNKSAFFERNPEAKIFLQTLERSDARYVIHELFNKHLRPEYFCDVASDMKKAGLTFVGNSEHFQNCRMMTPEPFRKLLDTASDKISAETHRSIIMNDRFRRDIYMKCKPSAVPQNKKIADYLGNLMFGAKKPLSDLNLEVQTGGYTLSLRPDIYLKIFEMLSEDQLTVREINQKLGRSEKEIGETVENTVNCMLSDQFNIFLRKRRNVEHCESFVFTSEYNLNQIVNWDGQYSKYVFPASEVTGNAFPVTKKSALLLSAMYKFGISSDKVIDSAYEFIVDDIKKGRNIFGFSPDQDIRYLIRFDRNEIRKHLLNELQMFGIICGKS